MQVHINVQCGNIIMHSKKVTGSYSRSRGSVYIHTTRGRVTIISRHLYYESGQHDLCVICQRIVTFTAYFSDRNLLPVWM